MRRYFLCLFNVGILLLSLASNHVFQAQMNEEPTATSVNDSLKQDCMICLEPLLSGEDVLKKDGKQPVVVECGNGKHSAHLECILPNVLLQHRKCPTCRQHKLLIPEPDLLKVYETYLHALSTEMDQVLKENVIGIKQLNGAVMQGHLSHLMSAMEFPNGQREYLQKNFPEALAAVISKYQRLQESVNEKLTHSISEDFNRLCHSYLSSNRFHEMDLYPFMRQRVDRTYEWINNVKLHFLPNLNVVHLMVQAIFNLRPCAFREINQMTHERKLNDWLQMDLEAVEWNCLTVWKVWRLLRGHEECQSWQRLLPESIQVEIQRQSAASLTSSPLWTLPQQCNQLTEYVEPMKQKQRSDPDWAFRISLRMVESFKATASAFLDRLTIEPEEREQLLMNTRCVLNILHLVERLLEPRVKNLVQPFEQFHDTLSVHLREMPTSRTFSSFLRPQSA